jgi:hypothetical protein
MDKDVSEYCCSYREDDKTFGFRVKANTWEEAEERAKTVFKDAWVEGIFIEEIPL